MTAKRKARLNVYIHPENHERLKTYCQKTGRSMSFVINALLQSLNLDEIEFVPVFIKVSK